MSEFHYIPTSETRGLVMLECKGPYQDAAPENDDCKKCGRSMAAGVHYRDGTCIPKPEDCPDASVHGNPFRYCPYCTWREPEPPKKPCSVCNGTGIEERNTVQQQCPCQRGFKFVGDIA